MKVEDLVLGRHYKYKGIWGVMGIWDNILQLYGNANTTAINEAWGQFSPIIMNDDIAAELEEWPIKEKGLYEFPSFKEIALEAALKLYVPSTQTSELLLKDAQSIFEWLTK